MAANSVRNSVEAGVPGQIPATSLCHRVFLVSSLSEARKPDSKYWSFVLKFAVGIQDLPSEAEIMLPGVRDHSCAEREIIVRALRVRTAIQFELINLGSIVVVGRSIERPSPARRGIVFSIRSLVKVMSRRAVVILNAREYPTQLRSRQVAYRYGHLPKLQPPCTL